MEASKSGLLFVPELELLFAPAPWTQFSFSSIASTLPAVVSVTILMEESAEEVGRIDEGSSIFSILVIFANDRLGCGFAYLEPRELRKPLEPREPRKPV